jgi:Tol biopolymer transport system component
MSVFLFSIITALLFVGCTGWVDRTAEEAAAPSATNLQFDGEQHLTNLRQLTFGGQNAEAYFSFDGTELIFQSLRDPLQCDAIFRMRADGSDVRMVSSGKGATTCAFIAPDGRSIIYASTHLGGEMCPPKPDHSRGYVWPLYTHYDIFKADPEGGNLVRLTDTDGYDAEAVYSPQGDKIVFTSVRTGDLELFLMNPDGTGVEQLTHAVGYDGGAFFSRDGQWIVWRASRPAGDAREDYSRLLAQGLIRPSQLELYIMKLADREPIQLTSNGAANFAPYWHPDEQHVIFASNVNDPRGRNFDLYTIDIESREIEQITYYPGFDGFPMFSHDGKRLVFASNRNGKVKGETNIFSAGWRW